MTHSKLTNRIHLAPASQHSSRNGTTVDTFLIHHQASTNSAATESAMVNATKDVSANYIITNEGELVLIVDEDRRAHTSGSRYDGGRGAQWDRRSITVEIENETGAPDWKISAKAIKTAARLLVDLRKRRKVTKVFGHRDLWERFRASYPTFCPGPDTVAKIVNAADALTKGGTSTPAASKPAAAPAKRSSWSAMSFGIAEVEATKAQWKTIQKWLKKLGRYDGPVDGVPGQNTWKGIQTTVKKYGYYDGPVDGEPGTYTAKGMQMYARDGGGYKGRIDGKLGKNSWAGFVKRLSS